ncbi:MAG TPA: hypothetical protein VIF57_02115 [Polyangia bacterium]|jgi:hypothetical protein
MRAPMIRPRIAFAAVMAWAAVTAAAPRPARAADPLPQRATGLVVKNGQLQISVGLQDLFGPAERQHLTSGFSTRILIRVALQDAGDAEGEPLALAVQRAEIVYDIWDEKFSVRVTRGLGAELRAIAPTAEEAIWRATALWQFPIAETKRLRPGGRYMVLVRGDLNPISEDLLADVRRWLVQPARGQRRLGAGDSFFGSFVSIFVNPRIEDSERQVRFVSQSFMLPSPLPPSPIPPPSPARGGAVGGRPAGKGPPP